MTSPAMTGSPITVFGRSDSSREAVWATCCSVHVRPPSREMANELTAGSAAMTLAYAM